MEKSEILEQNESQALMLEDKISDDQSEVWNELNFPWPLINLIMDTKKGYKSKFEFVKDLLFSFRLQLLVMSIICILCIIFPSVFLANCHDYHMLCVVYIVQGSCSLFVTLIHVCMIAFDLTPSKMAQLPVKYRWSIYYIIAFTHLITIFCIIWFFFSHIWFIGLFSSDWYYGCGSTLRIFGIIMLIIQYIFGIWIVSCRICNSPRILRWIAKTIENHLDRFPNIEKIV